MKIEEWVDLTLPKSKCTILYHISVFLSAQTQIILQNPHIPWICGIHGTDTNEPACILK